MLRLANIAIVLALLGGTAAAFAVAEKVKLERSPVTAPRFEPPDRRFSPVCRCDTDSATVSLRFRKGDTVDGIVVDTEGNVVRTLFQNRPVKRGRVTLPWDGRDDSGEVVADGRYRVGVHLQRERRTIVVPIPLALDTKAPKVRAVRVTPAVISPDGDGRSDRARITYRSSEKATAELLVEGQVVVRGKTRAKGKATIEWRGTVDGVPVKAGTYELTLRVRDLAGNATERLLPVRVRYIELVDPPTEARAGGRLAFTVSTDAASYRWYLFRPLGNRPGRPVLFDENATEAEVEVALPAGLEPGAYLLRVSERGHRDRAVLMILPPR